MTTNYIKPTYSIFINGDEYILSYFFDTDLGDALEVKDAITNKHVVDLLGYLLPDLEDSEAIEAFENSVKKAIKAHL